MSGPPITADQVKAAGTGGASKKGKMPSMRDLLNGVTIPLIVWIMYTLAGIQANSFTARDGLEVWKEIGAIRTELANTPPPEMLNELSEIKTRLAVIEAQLIHLSEKR